MRKNRYTYNEIVLCTYAAMYDIYDFGGIDKIFSLMKRSRASIKMKISNIASMLDEEGISRHNYDRINPLTGMPPGESGRRTDWDIVEKLYPLNKNEFLKKCKTIITNNLP